MTCDWHCGCLDCACRLLRQLHPTGMTYRVQHISELIPEALFSLERRAAVRKTETAAGGHTSEERRVRPHSSDLQGARAPDPAPHTARAA